MKQAVLSAEITIRCQKGGSISLPLLDKKIEEGQTSFAFGNGKVKAGLTVKSGENILTGSVSVSLSNEPFRENDNLALTEPVAVSLTLKEKPRRMTAMYLHRDWWTRPAFTENLEELPERTQCVYMEYPDAYGCLLLMAGTECKAMAKGGEKGKLTFILTAYRAGLNRISETAFILAEGESVYSCAHDCCTEAAADLGILLKTQKTYPPVFDTLGWCSWDAFYTDISEKKVLEKAAELSEKKVPARWFLLDDGWLSVRDNRLYDLIPEKEKFPEGFSDMIRQIKDLGTVWHVGVWHALGGYWGGVEPGSRAAASQEKHLYETAAGKLLPFPEAERGYGFYRDWYELLRREGIDFVKVDGQSAVKNYYENELPVCRAARETHRALEGAAGAYMGGNLINCMGMGMENVMGRQGSALSRNSDDFVPDNPDGFAEHLMQNAYNALYQDEFYYCDWDMFWTSHPDAIKHAILRAVSGGPVYFSDRIGYTDPEAVRPLVYGDGSLLRMERAAKPSPDCLFADPSKGGLMKLSNVARCGVAGRPGGAVAVYNISQEEASGQLGADDVYDLPAGEYYCHDWLSGCGRLLQEGDFLPVTLSAGGFALYLLIPVIRGRAVLGLTDKYIGFHAVEERKELPDGFQAILKQGGTIGFYSQKPVVSCRINGKDYTQKLKRSGDLYLIECNEEGRAVLTVQ